MHISRQLGHSRIQASNQSCKAEIRAAGSPAPQSSYIERFFTLLTARLVEIGSPVLREALEIRDPQLSRQQSLQDFK